MPSETNPLFVISGGPGCGKTTLLIALAEAGHATVAESARAVIRDEIATGGEAPPWADQGRFARAILERDLAKWRAHADRSGPIFFDRALPETAAIWESNGLAVPPDVRAAIAGCRFNRTVFVAPYWPAIYHQDAERKQTHEEAAYYAALTGPTYAAFGYVPVELPVAPVAERVAFVLERIGA
jgi:predicted ATPase